ncbi:MAG: DUF1295 domain-containing protein [Pseudomonadota bacterium]
MDSFTTQSLVGIAAAMALGAGIAWAGSHGSVLVGGWPAFGLCVAIAFAVQYVGFVPSFLAQTEHYFDLTGSVTYAFLAGFGLLLGNGEPRSLLIGALVIVWAARLGSFLFMRVRADGSDGRFDRLKPSFLRFFMVWNLQAAWISITFAAGLAAMTSVHSAPLGGLAAIGLAMWLAGFAIEVIADRQKRAFRADAINDGRFITSGLWSWSRHPNYFGEILLWAGICMLAYPALRGWQLAALISPLFVYVLLRHVSGVPLLESRAKKRWGGDPAYEEYVAHTPVLLLSPPKRVAAAG